MEMGPHDVVNYDYAANVYIQKEKTKTYERMGIILLSHCEDDDLHWELPILTPVDNLTISNPLHTLI